MDNFIWIIVENQLLIQDLRFIVKITTTLFTLNTYRSNAQFFGQIVFHDAFSAIINNIKPMPPAPQSYALQTSPITTSYSRMSAINREDLLSETTDHTEENDDDNDDDDDDEYSDDESEGDDEDMNPPGS